MSKKLERIENAYFRGQCDKWHWIKNQKTEPSNPWGKLCEEGCAYMCGCDDFPDRWDAEHGGTHIPEEIFWWRQKYVALMIRQGIKAELMSHIKTTPLSSMTN